MATDSGLSGVFYVPLLLHNRLPPRLRGFLTTAFIRDSVLIQASTLWLDCRACLDGGSDPALSGHFDQACWPWVDAHLIIIRLALALEHTNPKIPCALLPNDKAEVFVIDSGCFPIQAVIFDVFLDLIETTLNSC